MESVANVEHHGISKVGGECLLNENVNLLNNSESKLNILPCVHACNDQLLDASADTACAIATFNVETESDSQFERASPALSVNVSELSDSEEESEIRKNIVLNTEAIHTGECINNISGEIYVMEPKVGDHEISFRSGVATSTDSVRNDNIIYDMNFMFAWMKGLGSQMHDIKEQNNMMIQDRVFLIGKVEGIETKVTEVLHINNKKVAEGMRMVHSGIKENMDQLQEGVKNNLATSTAGIKGDMLDFKNDMKNEIKCDMLTFKKEIADNQNTIKNGITNELSVFGDKMKGNMVDLRGKVESCTDGIQTNMVEIKSTQTSINNQIIIQKEYVENISHTVISAVSGIERKVERIKERVDTCTNDIEIVQEDITQIKYDLYEEIETRDRQITELSNRLIVVEQEQQESKIECLAATANQSIQDRVMKADIIKVVDAYIENRIKSIENIEVKEIANKVKELEEKAKANSAQGNELNNHLHMIEARVNNVQTVMPEMLQSTILQAMGHCKGETDNLRFQNTTLPHGYPAPTQYQSSFNNQAPLPNTTALPSISSSPLLPENYITPSPPPRNNMPQDVHSMVPHVRSLRSDHVIADLVRREQKPTFTGENVSAPVFLREVENFFALIQVNDDWDKLQVFPTFLIGNPSEWWKLISHQIDTWDMAKTLLLRQYFNEYERQRYKQEWYDLRCEDFASIEEFTLHGLKILNTIKTKDTDQKRCERITMKLPEPLRDYLLNRYFTSTQDYLNQIKEAMRLKNFDLSQYYKASQLNNNRPKGNNYNSQNGSPGNYNSKYYSNSGSNNNQGSYNQQAPNNGYNSNRNNANNNSNQNGNKINNNGNGNNNAQYPAMNPKYKGKPSNYDPNFDYHANKANANSYNNNNSQPFHGNQNQGNNYPNGYNQNTGSNYSNGYSQSQGYNYPKAYNQNNQNSYQNNGNRQNGSRHRKHGRSFFYSSQGQNNNLQANASNNQALGVNQVGWANTPANSLPLAIMPPQPPVGVPPPSPTATNFYFNFGPDMIPVALKPTSATMSSVPAQTQNTDEQDTVVHTEN